MNDTSPTWFEMRPALAARDARNPKLAYFQNQFAANLLLAMFGHPPSAN